MTDPVTNVEIEDVLSSIRRLVSENVRAEHAPKPDEDDATPTDADTESESRDAQMLVLTPALRVPEDAGETPRPEVEAPDTQDSTERDLLGLIGGVADQGALETAIEEAVHDVVEEAVEAAVSDYDGDDDVSDNWAENLSFIHSDTAAHAPEMSTLEGRIAGLEAAVAARDDDWEPDGVSDDENEGAPVAPLNWEDSDIAVARWSGEEGAEDAEVISDLGVDVSALDLSEFAETDPDQRAPDGGAPQGVSDHIEGQEQVDPQLLQGLEPETGASRDDMAVIDEGMLRDMVAEIVREELQGSLGERITRNVRKLVRREIHRALTAREWD